MKGGRAKGGKKEVGQAAATDLRLQVSDLGNTILFVLLASYIFGLYMCVCVCACARACVGVCMTLDGLCLRQPDLFGNIQFVREGNLWTSVELSLKNMIRNASEIQLPGIFILNNWRTFPQFSHWMSA